MGQVARRPRQYISSRATRAEFDPPPEPVSGFVIPEGGFAGNFGPTSPPFVRLARLDFRSATIQRKPTIAVMTALGIPTPSRFYALTEAAVPFSDGADGAENLTVVVSPTRVLFQRTMVGLSADGATFQPYTGVEFRGATYASASNAALQVGNNLFMNVGGAGSGDVRAVGILARGVNFGLQTDFCGKRDPVAPNAGWSFGVSVGGALRILADGGAAVVATATVRAHIATTAGPGPWFFAIGRVRRQGGASDVVEILTVHESVSAVISALGSLSTATPFGLGTGSPGLTNTLPSLQVAALYCWEDSAAAASLTQAHVQALFTHAMDPTGLLSTYTRAGTVCEEIGYEAGHGYLLGCYDGLSSAGRTAQVDLGYAAAFAHVSRLGLRANIATQNLCTHSDDFANAAWTKTTMTIDTTSALMADGPDKTRSAQRLTATAANALIEDTLATVAATEYTQSILLRSGTGANVACRLIQRNLTAGVDNAFSDIVVTPEWQRFDLTAITAAGQVSTGFRLRIDANGAVIYGKLATFVLGRRGLLVSTGGAAATTPATNIQAASAAGAWVRGARGEIDVLAATLTPTETYGRRIMLASVGGTLNARGLFIRTTDQTRGEVFDNAGVQDHTIDSAIYDHSVPFTARLLWRTPSPPAYQPNFLSALVDNGVPVGGSAGPPWTIGDTVTTIYIGQNATAINQLNGLVALMDFWNLPRGSIPAWP